MKLSDHDLQQLDTDWLHKRSREELLYVSQKLLEDLKEARERLNRNSSNSSVPPGSQAPWFRPGEAKDDDEDEDDTLLAPEDKTADDPTDTQETAAPAGETAEEPKAPKVPKAERSAPRNPGKQPGAQGFGRTQILPLSGTEHHYAEACAGCGKTFADDAISRAYTGFYTVDIEYGAASAPGVRVINTLHRYYDRTCECGHGTRLSPHRQAPEALFEGIELSEWRLASPALMSLIVFLSLRMRLSRARIREFLGLWLGIELSTGTINQCIHEAGRSVAPLEDELVEAVLASDLLHADETPWKVAGETLWLWVFVSNTVTLYYVAYRSKELVRNLLDGFTGWLMSDGYLVYREISKRLRCWAHLERKAKGLAESLDRPTAAFGKSAHTLLKTLMAAIYQAREGPPGMDLAKEHSALLADFKQKCERMSTSSHKKARALAVEFLNDWETIFVVLRHPHLPLTNNEAERALRHWVILRKISHGTHSDPGTRVFALLASVIDTCRRRDVSPWRYLEQVIRERRAGRNAPPLATAAGVGV